MDGVESFDKELPEPLGVIKKDGSRWIKSDYKSSGISAYEKVMDNVIYADTYTSGDSQEGIALCSDGSLWNISGKEPGKLLDGSPVSFVNETFAIDIYLLQV